MLCESQVQLLARAKKHTYLTLGRYMCISLLGLLLLKMIQSQCYWVISEVLLCKPWAVNPWLRSVSEQSWGVARRYSEVPV